MKSRAVKHKYHARPTQRAWEDGSVIHFPSKREAEYYDKLCLAKRSGDLLFFLRQVPFHLPGGVTVRMDFVEFWGDGSVRFTDAKGPKTQQYLRNKKLVEALYPVTVEEV